MDFDPHYSCLSLFPPRSAVIPIMDRLLCCMLLGSPVPVDVAVVMGYVVASLTLRGGSPVSVRVTVSHVLSLCRA